VLSEYTISWPRRSAETSSACLSTERWCEIDGLLIAKFSAIEPAVKSPSAQGGEDLSAVGSDSALKTSGTFSQSLDVRHTSNSLPGVACVRLRTNLPSGTVPEQRVSGSALFCLHPEEEALARVSLIRRRRLAVMPARRGDGHDVRQRDVSCLPKGKRW